MMDPNRLAARQNLLRSRNEEEHTRVTFVELFFDLVFVFAVTQLSHLLLHHLTLGGALQTLLLLLAVWWVWVYTSWATNWLDPDATPVRVMLFALMLAGLVMASAIPKASETRGLWFAVAYVAMQVGRSLYMLWALYGNRPTNYRNFQRITIWLSASAVLWITGGFVEGQARLVCWVVAMLLELISPSLGFWAPGSDARAQPIGTSRASIWPNVAAFSSSLRLVSRSWWPAQASRI
jgi:low temperature requirement protein LtrA